MLNAAIQRAPPADHHPAYTGMIVDPEERIWPVSCEPLDSSRCRVTILTGSGDRIGQFALPTGFVLHDVGRRGVVGVTDHQDERGRVIEYRALPRALR